MFSTGLRMRKSVCVCVGGSTYAYPLNDPDCVSFRLIGKNSEYWKHWAWRFPSFVSAKIRTQKAGLKLCMLFTGLVVRPLRRPKIMTLWGICKRNKRNGSPLIWSEIWWSSSKYWTSPWIFEKFWCEWISGISCLSLLVYGVVENRVTKFLKFLFACGAHFRMVENKGWGCRGKGS